MRPPFAAISAALLAIAAGRALAQDATPPPAVDFATQVWPILEARCVDCHRAPYRDDAGRQRNPKGGLRLDGREWILRGGDGADAVVAGDPAASALYARTILDADDPDLMPEEGERLTAAETELLRRWIAEGAAFGTWTGSSAPAAAPPRVPTRVANLAALGAHLQPPTDKTLGTALGAHGRAQPLDAEGRLLRVSFPAHQPDTDDRAVDALAPLRAHIAELDLARTVAGDAALRGVGRMRHLTALDLTRTGVTDRGLTALAGLEHLESLVLVGTAITDRGLDALASLPALRHLRVSGTAVTAAGIARLQAARPDLDVRWKSGLPAPDPTPTGTGRRNR